MDSPRTRRLNYASYPKLTRFIAKLVRAAVLVSLMVSSLLTVYAASVRQRRGAAAGRREKSASREAWGEETSDEREPCSFTNWLANSDALHRLYARLNLALKCFYLLSLLKAFLVLALGSEMLADFRYLDCYLVGRVTANARATQGVKYVGCTIMLAYIINRAICIHTKPNFDLSSVEFLVRSLASFERAEQRHQPHKIYKLPRCECEPSLRHLTPLTSEDERQLVPGEGFQLLRRRGPLNEQAGAGKGDWKRNFKRSPKPRQPFDQRHLSGARERACSIGVENCTTTTTTRASVNNLLVLRLNRNKHAWFHTNFGLSLISLHCLTTLAGTLLLFGAMCTPTIVTRLGFEVNYPHCVGFIERLVATNRTEAQLYEHIHKPQRWAGQAGARSNPTLAVQSMPFFLPLENFTTGRYHAMRMFADYLESMIFYADLSAFLLAHFILLAPLNYDTMTNSDLLYKRLVCLRTSRWHELNRRLGERNKSAKQQPSQPSDYQCTINYQPPAKRSCRLLSLSGYDADLHFRERSRQLDVDRQLAEGGIGVIQLQALLLDHFKMVANYNTYFSFHCTFCALLWLAYSSVLLLWLNDSGSGAIHFEFYLALYGTAMFTLAYFVTIAIAGALNKRFYPVIASLMALDDGRSITKRRWMNILDYFHPKPMYCYTMISFEISLFFVLKMIAWTFSALFVILSFFHISR